MERGRGDPVFYDRAFFSIAPMTVDRHCEERSDEGIQEILERPLDGFASIPMTTRISLVEKRAERVTPTKRCQRIARARIEPISRLR